MPRLRNHHDSSNLHDIIPITTRSPADWVARHGLPPGGALFDALGPAAGPARYAALCLDPVGHLSWRLGERVDPFDALDALRRAVGPWPASPGPQPQVACLLAYDLGRAVERVPTVARADLSLPDLWAARYAAAFVWDRAQGHGWIAGQDAAARHALAARLDAGGPISDPLRPGPVRPELDRSDYVAALACIQGHIAAGEIYQANFALRFSAPCEGGDPGPLFGRLHAASPVPYAACVRPTPGAAVLSVSPERFLRWTADGQVETRPIKGTLPREADAAGLLASAKDRAEHVMIVDLERNDLGRVCQVGSVRVPELMAVESYATVHHLVSTVRGQLRAGVGLPELLRATFPGGSITGAPKLRAMEVIESLEPVRRGPYCGAVGYLDARGGGDLNIAIRTAWVDDGRLYYSAGGGIVADSAPETEWAEVGWKARAFIEACAAHL